MCNCIRVYLYVYMSVRVYMCVSTLIYACVGVFYILERLLSAICSSLSRRLSSALRSCRCRSLFS